MSTIDKSFLTNNYFGTSTTGVSTLFGSLSTGSSNSTSSMSSLLADYSSIKNGSYKKLLTAYYEKTDTSKKSSGSDTTDTSTEKKNAISDREAASSLKKSASALVLDGKDSVFNKVTKTDEEGKTTSEYDVDKIYKAVSQFVEDYNDMIRSAGNSSSTSVLSAGSGMALFTKANSRLLGQVGITIGTDNKLSIDEEAFKKADMATVKSLFNGRGSYGYQMESYASQIANSANSQLAQLSGSMYTSVGTYGAGYGTSGSLYSGIL